MNLSFTLMLSLIHCIFDSSGVKSDLSFEFFLKGKWCNWGSWSKCYLAHCQNKISYTEPLETLHSESDIQCINMKKTRDNSHLVKIRGSNDFRMIQAKKYRVRYCNCTSNGFFFSKFISKDSCDKQNKNEIQCGGCSHEDTVFHPINSTNPVPWPECEENDFWLYELIFGLTGSLAGIMIIVCSVRVFSSRRLQIARICNFCVTSDPDEDSAEYPSQSAPMTSADFVLATSNLGSSSLNPHSFPQPKPPSYQDVINREEETLQLPMSPFGSRGQRITVEQNNDLPSYEEAVQMSTLTPTFNTRDQRTNDETILHPFYNRDLAEADEIV